MPPAQSAPRSGRHRMAGRLTQALGTLVGSKAMKEEGLRKERAVDYARAEADLAEAERLEKQALVARQRAVARGECAVKIPSQFYPSGFRSTSSSWSFRWTSGWRRHSGWE